MKRSVFIFYSCSTKAGTCTAATQKVRPLSPIFTLTALLYFPTTRILEGLPKFSTRCARYRPETDALVRMEQPPARANTDDPIADTSAFGMKIANLRAVTVLSNRQANVCANYQESTKTKACKFLGSLPPHAAAGSRTYCCGRWPFNGKAFRSFLQIARFDRKRSPVQVHLVRKTAAPEIDAAASARAIAARRTAGRVSGGMLSAGAGWQG